MCNTNTLPGTFFFPFILLFLASERVENMCWHFGIGSNVRHLVRHTVRTCQGTNTSGCLHHGRRHLDIVVLDGGLGRGDVLDV